MVGDSTGTMATHMFRVVLCIHVLITAGSSSERKYGEFGRKKQIAVQPDDAQLNPLKSGGNEISLPDDVCDKCTEHENQRTVWRLRGKFGTIICFTDDVYDCPDTNQGHKWKPKKFEYSDLDLPMWDIIDGVLLKCSHLHECPEVIGRTHWRHDKRDLAYTEDFSDRTVYSLTSSDRSPVLCLTDNIDDCPITDRGNNWQPKKFADSDLHTSHITNVNGIWFACQHDKYHLCHRTIHFPENPGWVENKSLLKNVINKYDVEAQSVWMKGGTWGVMNCFAKSKQDCPATDKGGAWISTEFKTEYLDRFWFDDTHGAFLTCEVFCKSCSCPTFSGLTWKKNPTIHL